MADCASTIRHAVDSNQSQAGARRYLRLMQIPLQISLRGLKRSDAILEAIRERAGRLEHFHDRIMSCRVVVELGSLHKHQGRQFSVHIDLKVPGSEIAVTHEHAEDFQVALRKAFDAARRKLEDTARERRGDVKDHSQAR
jgi:ribosomal subunit interface protein